MASYTGGSTVTLTTGELNNSTVANIAKTGADAYTSVLTLKTAATANNLLVTAGGSLRISKGGVVNDLTVDPALQKPNIQVLSGGILNNADLTHASTLEFWTYAGATINNLSVDAQDLSTDSHKS